MRSGIGGIASEQTRREGLPRHSLGLSPVTPRCSHRLAERLRARPLSPLPVGDHPTAACSVTEVEALALKGSLRAQCRWVSVAVRPQHHR